MAQGVSCPNGRPQHTETPAVIDFGPDFADLSRTSEVESDKEVAKTNVDLIGASLFFSSFVFVSMKYVECFQKKNRLILVV